MGHLTSSQGGFSVVSSTSEGQSYYLHTGKLWKAAMKIYSLSVISWLFGILEDIGMNAMIEIDWDGDKKCVWFENMNFWMFRKEMA